MMAYDPYNHKQFTENVNEYLNMKKCDILSIIPMKNPIKYENAFNKITLDKMVIIKAILKDVAEGIKEKDDNDRNALITIYELTANIVDEYFDSNYKEFVNDSCLLREANYENSYVNLYSTENMEIKNILQDIFSSKNYKNSVDIDLAVLTDGTAIYSFRIELEWAKE